MNMLKVNFFHFTILFLSILCVISIKIYAQEDAKSLVYHGYIMNSESIQKEAIKNLRTKYETDENNIDVLYQLLEAQYILLNGTMATQNEDLFDEYVDDAVDNAEKILKKEKRHAKTKALLSSILGLKIAYSPMKGMFLGGKSSKLAAEAISEEKEEPLAWFKYGSNKYNTPEMWGGDKKIGLESYEKTVNLYEKNSNNLQNNFHYLDALAWLGIAYKNAGQLEKAKDQFEKALGIEPEFNWVKYSLLPSTQEALKQ